MIIDRPSCKRWRENPTTNPVSNRPIMPNKYTYNLFKRYCDLTDNDCAKWRENPRKNPLTNRRIRLVTVRGLYHQIEGICNSRNQASNSPQSPINLFKSDSSDIDKMVEERLTPLLNTNRFGKMRSIMAKIARKYLVNISPCLKQYGSNLSLANKKGETRVMLTSSLKEGVTYESIGTRSTEHTHFSIKILKNNEKGNKEVEISKQLSTLVEGSKNQHFPIVYKDLTCPERCDLPICPEITKYQNGYRIMIGEIASMDLLKFLETEKTLELYGNIITQMFIAVYSLHNAGYIHNDTHLRNFLIQRIKKGGHWHYNIDGKDYYLENHGFIVMLCDFGEAERESGHDYKIIYKDYMNFIKILSNLKRYHPTARALPEDLQDKLKDLLKHIKANLYRFPDKALIQQVLDFPKNFLGVKTIMTDRKNIEGTIINPEKTIKI